MFAMDDDQLLLLVQNVVCKLWYGIDSLGIKRWHLYLISGEKYTGYR